MPEDPNIIAAAEAEEVSEQAGAGEDLDALFEQAATGIESPPETPKEEAAQPPAAKAETTEKPQQEEEQAEPAPASPEALSEAEKAGAALLEQLSRAQPAQAPAPQKTEPQPASAPAAEPPKAPAAEPDLAAQLEEVLDSGSNADVAKKLSELIGGLKAQQAQAAAQDKLSEAVRPMLERLQSVEAELARERQMSAISRKAGYDVRLMIGPDEDYSPEVKAWLGKQSAALQALAYHARTVEDGALFVKAYRDSLLQAEQAKSAEARGREKARVDDLHKHTVRGQSGKFAKSAEDFDPEKEFEKAARGMK